MPRLSTTLLCIAAAMAFAMPASAQKRHVSKEHGYQIVPPAKWSLIPLKVEEKWIVGKWLCNKKYVDRETSFYHQPQLRVISFERQDNKTKGGEKKKDEGLKAGDSISLQAPYKDYKDYLKRNFSGGGYFISAEKQTKMGRRGKKINVTMLEVKIEKLATTGKKRIFCWVFQAAWGELAVECDALEAQVKKIQPIAFAAFKSFKVIERETKKKSEIETGSRIKIVENETPAQQKKRRKKQQEIQFKKAIAQLPDGWTHKRSKHFLILNHGKEKFMMKVITHAEAVRAWLEKNFKDIGKGYVQHGIIRICANSDEERAFRKGSGDAWSSETREAVISAKSDFGSYEFEYLGEAIMQMYFSDKNEDLYRSLPVWLERGLEQYIGTARANKRGRLEFAPDSSENTSMREARRQKKLVPVKDMFQMTGKDMWSGENSQYLYAQTASVMRFLMGPGKRNKMTKSLIKDYIANLLMILEENEKKAREAVKKSSSSKEMTEEEEEEAFKQRKNADWSAKEKEFLSQVFDRTFAKWNSKHWAWLQSSYEKFAK